MKKLATTVLVVVTLLLTSCSKDEPHNLHCECWVETPDGAYGYETRFTDCEMDGKVLYLSGHGDVVDEWHLRCKDVNRDPI